MGYWCACGPADLSQAPGGAREGEQAEDELDDGPLVQPAQLPHHEPARKLVEPRGVDDELAHVRSLLPVSAERGRQVRQRESDGVGAVH